MPPSSAKTAVRRDFHRKPRLPDLAAGWNRAEPRHEDVCRRRYSGGDPASPHRSLHAPSVGGRPPRDGSKRGVGSAVTAITITTRTAHPAGWGAATAAVHAGPPLRWRWCSGPRRTARIRRPSCRRWIAREEPPPPPQMGSAASTRPETFGTGPAATAAHADGSGGRRRRQEGAGGARVSGPLAPPGEATRGGAHL